MMRQTENQGKCDRCATLYDIGPDGLRREGDRCNDLSLRPPAGWPRNRCKGIVRRSDQTNHTEASTP